MTAGFGSCEKTHINQDTFWRSLLPEQNKIFFKQEVVIHQKARIEWLRILIQSFFIRSLNGGG